MNMTEDQAKNHLERMLKDFTPGSFLQLLAEVLGQTAEKARQDDNAVVYEHCNNAAIALFVMGLGIDAACPR
jgi:hypothetical protein